MEPPAGAPLATENWGVAWISKNRRVTTFLQGRQCWHMHFLCKGWSSSPFCTTVKRRAPHQNPREGQVHLDGHNHNQTSTTHRNTPRQCLRTLRTKQMHSYTHSHTHTHTHTEWNKPVQCIELFIPSQSLSFHRCDPTGPRLALAFAHQS